jgi:hypothetical protein
MGLVISPDSELGKELAKWNKPYRFEPYPKMLYKAQVRSNGQAAVMAPPVPLYGWPQPQDYERALLEAEAFTRSCLLTVRDEAEERRAVSDGWRTTAEDALKAHEAREWQIAQAAAERHYTEARMSPQAQAEAARVDDATALHVPEVPETPRRPHRRTTPRPDEKPEAQ